MFIISLYNRRTLSFAIMSNKFVLSDIIEGPTKSGCVVLISWVDSAEIASLVEEISI